MTCTICGQPLTADTAHAFEDPTAGATTTYCRGHCPRCKRPTPIHLPSTNGAHP